MAKCTSERRKGEHGNTTMRASAIERRPRSCGGAQRGILSRDNSAADSAAAVERYRKWLRLVSLHPDVAVAPTRDIDRMWHLHMLHPCAYSADCQGTPGFVLDHDGGFGADPEELPILQHVFETTAALWELSTGNRIQAERCRREPA